MFKTTPNKNILRDLKQAHAHILTIKGYDFWQDQDLKKIQETLQVINKKILETQEN